MTCEAEMTYRTHCKLLCAPALSLVDRGLWSIGCRCSGFLQHLVSVCVPCHPLLSCHVYILFDEISFKDFHRDKRYLLNNLGEEILVKYNFTGKPFPKIELSSLISKQELKEYLWYQRKINNEITIII